MLTKGNMQYTYGLLIGVLAALLLIYLVSLQRIPNGSSDPYMIDTGEVQIALNVWGTLHATGYPLYTILGNLFTPLAQIIGWSPAAAAGLFSTFWMLLALAGVYGLLWRVTKRPALAAGSVFLLGAMRSIWIHSVVAEVYSLSLAILIGLWWIALWPSDWPLKKRLWALALLGGIGIAHHRALAFTGLGLIYLLWPSLRAEWRTLPRILPISIILFLLGFLPYAYLPMRATAENAWLYSNDHNTWEGFWFLFWGREADYLVTRPDSWAGWWENLRGTLEILTREMSAAGLLIAFLATISAFWFRRRDRLKWRVLVLVWLSGLGYFAFAVAYHQAVLPEAILMMLLPSLVIGLALSLDALIKDRVRLELISAALLVLWGLSLFANQRAYVQSLTTDPIGLAAIEAASAVPRHNPMEEPVFMLSWGPRYFAAAYSRWVTGENADLLMVDHRADFSALAAEGYTFYTQPDTLYGYSPAWWAEQLGALYLTGVTPDLIRLGTSPRLIAPSAAELAAMTAFTPEIYLAGYRLVCESEGLTLSLGWYALAKPTEDLSVKVHLTSRDDPRPLAQADSSAPISGWRPTSTWEVGELISDHYRLPRHPEAVQIILGLYTNLPEEGFMNYGERIIFLSECP